MHLQQEGPAPCISFLQVDITKYTYHGGLYTRSDLRTYRLSSASECRTEWCDLLRRSDADSSKDTTQALPSGSLPILVLPFSQPQPGSKTVEDKNIGA